MTENLRTRLWSFNTSVRNISRVENFLKVLKIMEGEEWNYNSQDKFQTMLIKHRYYGYGEPQFENKLPQKFIDYMENKVFSYGQAKQIFDFTNPNNKGLRGRHSYNILKKLGLARIVNDKISITKFGNDYLNGIYNTSEVILRGFFHFQYPNFGSSYPSKDGWNIRPFIACVQLISKLNEKCKQIGIKDKGISKLEFSIFMITLSNYQNIDSQINKLLEFRKVYESKKTQEEKEMFAENYFDINFSHIKFTNRNQNCTLKAAQEYGDNMYRVCRETKFFNLRGDGRYLDIEQRKSIEINNILNISAESIDYDSDEDYLDVIGNPDKIRFPWESDNVLRKIGLAIYEYLLSKSGIDESESKHIINKLKDKSLNIHDLQSVVSDLQTKRENIEAQIILNESSKEENINECIEKLYGCYTQKIKDKGLSLEKYATIGLNIIDDAKKIIPNYQKDDYGEPLFTAQRGIPDIESYYTNFNLITEVSQTTNKTQWYAEGQPVMEHLLDFSEKNPNKKSYCLFIVPSIHRATANTFMTSVTSGFEGKKLNIIPITIPQFIILIKHVVKNKNTYNHQKLQNLFDKIISDARSIDNNNSEKWLSNIDEKFNTLRLK